jgi:hypothetical protein
MGYSIVGLILLQGVGYWSPMKLIATGINSGRPDEEDLRNHTGLIINFNSVINRESEG